MKETILPQIKSIKSLWSYYLINHRNSFMFSLVYLIIALLILKFFLQFIEHRDGFEFKDPILCLFSPIDLTWLTCLLIYCSLFFSIIHFIDKPRLFHIGVLTYAILVSLRVAAMYLLPLNPPQSMITLNDPFVQSFGFTDALTKDLFFSGHTSTLFMLCLVSHHKLIKILLLICTILVGIFVLLQHVHYSVDVFVAPFFAFIAYYISIRILPP